MNYVGSGLRVSKVPLKLSGSGTIEATSNGVRLVDLKPGTNWNALGGIAIAIVAIYATFKTGKIWMAVAGIGAAVGAGSLPKKAGATRITKEFPSKKVRNVHFGDPEANAHAVRNVSASAGGEVLWFEVKEEINWKSVKAVPNTGEANEFVEFANNRTGSR